jgi:threonine synthase
MWRWRELMPVRQERYIVSLGEGDTPLMHVPRLGTAIGCEQLLIKDESLNPTGSFKARGLSSAVSRAIELGVREVVVPTAGNAGSALAAYAARAGIRAHLFMPVDTPALNQKEGAIYGAEVVLVRGLINDCGAIARQRAKANGWFDLSTLKEPYRAEGKKTMGFELAEQLGWRVPDVIVYPTGGGTGVVGIWKALEELEAVGLVDSRRPRFYCVQASGCAPLVRAFNQGLDHAPAWENAATVASGLRVPGAVADYLILDVVRRSGGSAIEVSDEALVSGMREVGERTGIFAAPEGAATWAALKILVRDGVVKPKEQIVLLNTGTGLKYGELVQANFPTVSP